MLTIHYVSTMMRIFRLATALRMRPKHEYWCKCRWQTSGIKTAICDKLDHYWQLGFQWHRRDIELVYKSLDCFTMRLFHSATIFAATYVFVVWNFTKLITMLKSFYLCLFFFTFLVCVCGGGGGGGGGGGLTSIWWGSTQLQLISRHI